MQFKDWAVTFVSSYIYYLFGAVYESVQCLQGQGEKKDTD